MITYKGQKLEQAYVVYDGVYLNEDSQKVEPHDDASWEIYLKGLHSLQEELGYQDYLEGIQIKNDKNFAQWYIAGETKLIEITES